MQHRDGATSRHLEVSEFPPTYAWMYVGNLLVLL